MAQSVANREVEILNQLLTLTRDSLIGYREAAAATESRAMQRCFLRRATDRQVIADRLCEVIEALGGEAADEGTRLGVAHRVFLNLCELLPSGDAIAMHEVARGESFLRGRYERALHSGTLSPPARDVVQEAYGSVWSGVRAVPGMRPHRSVMHPGLRIRPQAM